MWEVFSAGASPYAAMGNAQVVNYVSSCFAQLLNIKYPA